MAQRGWESQSGVAHPGQDSQETRQPGQGQPRQAGSLHIGPKTTPFLPGNQVFLTPKLGQYLILTLSFCF
jgi:hypothetical protein